METLDNALITFFGTVLTILLTVIGYFLKQLHADFKKMNFDISDVKGVIRIIEQKQKGNSDLLGKSIEFLEKRVTALENQLTKNVQSN